MKELKSGLHLEQMPVTGRRACDTLHGAVSAGLCVLGPLYVRDEVLSKDWSLFKLKERLIEVTQEAVTHPVRKCQYKLNNMNCYF
jgi:hypothetical protein